MNTDWGNPLEIREKETGKETEAEVEVEAVSGEALLSAMAFSKDNAKAALPKIHKIIKTMLSPGEDLELLLSKKMDAGPYMFMLGFLLQHLAQHLSTIVGPTTPEFLQGLQQEVHDLFDTEVKRQAHHILQVLGDLDTDHAYKEECQDCASKDYCPKYLKCQEEQGDE